MKSHQFQQYHKITIAIIMGILLMANACNYYPSEQYEINLDKNLHSKIQYDYQEEEAIFQQVITLKNERNNIILKSDTPSKSLKIYLDTLIINGKEKSMIFIYNLYLGWAIIDHYELKMYKAFTEIPTDLPLLKKLSLIENPVWVLE